MEWISILVIGMTVFTCSYACYVMCMGYDLVRVRAEVEQVNVQLTSYYDSDV
jgi:hypothetical protein